MKQEIPQDYDELDPYDSEVLKTLREEAKKTRFSWDPVVEFLGRPRSGRAGELGLFTLQERWAFPMWGVGACVHALVTWTVLGIFDDGSGGPPWQVLVASGVASVFSSLAVLSATIRDERVLERENRREAHLVIIEVTKSLRGRVAALEESLAHLRALRAAERLNLENTSQGEAEE